MKLDERQIELIQADVDGELAGADRGELSALSAGQSRLRALHDDLRGRVRRARADAAGGAARGAARAVLGRVARRAATGAAPAAGFPVDALLHRLQSALRGRFRRRPAGQRAGIPVRHLAGSGQLSVNQLVGTMARAVAESVESRAAARSWTRPRSSCPGQRCCQPAWHAGGARIGSRFAPVRTSRSSPASKARRSVLAVSIRRRTEPDVRVGAFVHERHGGRARSTFR